jgi:hypothetical protein
MKSRVGLVTADSFARPCAFLTPYTSASFPPTQFTFVNAFVLPLRFQKNSGSYHVSHMHPARLSVPNRRKNDRAI